MEFTRFHPYFSNTHFNTILQAMSRSHTLKLRKYKLHWPSICDSEYLSLYSSLWHRTVWYIYSNILEAVGVYDTFFTFMQTVGEIWTWRQGRSVLGPTETRNQCVSRNLSAEL